MSDPVLIAIIAALQGVATAYLARRSKELHEKVDEIHKEVNGQTAELLKVTGEAEHAKGHLQGRRERDATISNRPPDK